MFVKRVFVENTSASRTPADATESLQLTDDESIKQGNEKYDLYSYHKKTRLLVSVSNAVNGPGGFSRCYHAANPWVTRDNSGRM